MVDEGEQSCGLCCWACSGVQLLQLTICQEFSCSSYRHIHLSSSTARAGCLWGHGNLTCRGCAVIFYLNQMNLLTQSYYVQIKATWQYRCLLEGQCNHSHLSVARLLILNGWWNRAQLHIWEGAAWWSGWHRSSLHTHLLHNSLWLQLFNFCCSSEGTGGIKESVPQSTTTATLTSSLLSLVPKKTMQMPS